MTFPKAGWRFAVLLRSLRHRGCEARPKEMVQELMRRHKVPPLLFWRLLLLVDRPSDALRLLYRTFVPEREWLTLRYGLEDATGWRVRLQQVWHPLRVLARRGAMCSSG